MAAIIQKLSYNLAFLVAKVANAVMVTMYTGPLQAFAIPCVFQSFGKCQGDSSAYYFYIKFYDGVVSHRGELDGLTTVLISLFLPPFVDR